MTRRRKTPSAGKRKGSTVRDLLEQAAAYQQAGHTAQAEAICKRILEARPDQPHALYQLAVSAYQARKDPAAVAALQRAVQLKPDFAPAWNALGYVLRDQRQLDAALDAYRKALELEPEMVAAHQGVGATLLAGGQIEPALASFAKAIELAPDSVAVATELATALRSVGRGEQSLVVARETVRRLPESSEAHGLLAIELHHHGQFEDSVDSHRRALALSPDSAVAHTNLGVTLQALGDFTGAAASHRQAVALDPRNANAQHNLGRVLMQLNLLDEAVECHRAAIAGSPGNADAHWDCALAMLGAGRMREGWEELEWRWRAAAFPTPDRHTDRPRWDGSELSGRRLLLWAEQGLGDTIHFARYLPLLARPGASLALECAPHLERLMHSLAGIESVVTREGSARNLDGFDVHLPLLSVPRLFGTTPSSIPAKVPYLAADAADRERWRAELDGGDSLRVGVVWAGSATHANDRNRSIAPDLLEPLLALPGVRWFGLQVGDRAAQPTPGALTDLGPRLTDFAETAAVIANLDLVLTVDTAVAHLAGAIGAPVWVLLPHVPDWRWMLDREDSPWYPTMRLFRQQQRGEWQPVIERVAAELRSRTEAS